MVYFKIKMFEEEKQITVEILEQVVAKYFSCNVPDVTIINYECSAGSNKGDNFTCVVIAVKVKAKVGDKLHEELSYMVKVMPNNEYRASWLNEVKHFAGRDFLPKIAAQLFPTLYIWKSPLCTKLISHQIQIRHVESKTVFFFLSAVFNLSTKLVTKI